MTSNPGDRESTLESALKYGLPTTLVRAGSWVLDRSLPGRRAVRRELGQYGKKTARVVPDLISRHGPIVQTGPFAGLRLLPDELRGSSLAPMLLGSYEEELHSVLEELIAARPKRIINIGSGEGYYAVGLACRLPGADVYAFDIDPPSQQLARETAGINRVSDRVYVDGVCTQERLEELLMPQTLVMMDCEGCELALLHPTQVPSLRNTTLLVELHDWVDPNTSSTVLLRFRDTHSSRIIGVAPRVVDDYPVLQELDPAVREFTLQEGRPTEPHPMEWVVLYPLASA
jgi:hypothetical protein